jgi:flagellar motor switch protein FliM
MADPSPEPDPAEQPEPAADAPADPNAPAAGTDGDPPVGSPVGPPGQEPLPDDLTIFSRVRRDFEDVSIASYDFKHPERIGKDQLRALQTVHDTFARSYGAALTGLLRTIVEIRVSGVEQMTYARFTDGLPNPTAVNVIDAPELGGPMCLELSPLVVYPMIDRLLGGTNQELFVPQREMTDIELRLVQSLLEPALVAFGEAWGSVKTIAFTVGQTASNPHVLQIVPPNELVVVVGFEITLASRAATMSLCIPFNAIEPTIETRSARAWDQGGRGPDGEQWGRMLEGHLAGAPLELTGVLAETSLTLGQLRRLEVGDLLLTGRAADDPVALEVAGRSKFLARMGQFKGNRALQVIRPVRPSDRRQGATPAASAADARPPATGESDRPDGVESI